MRRKGRGSVYIAYGKNREVLYVGASTHLPTRLYEHDHGKDWWGDVAVIETEHFPTIAQAQDRERELISRLSPLHNIQGRTDLTKLAPTVRWLRGAVLYDKWDAFPGHRSFLHKLREASHDYDLPLWEFIEYLGLTKREWETLGNCPRGIPLFVIEASIKRFPSLRVAGRELLGSMAGEEVPA